LGNEVEFEPSRSRLIYEKGKRLGLWENAEECILLLDEARMRGIAAEAVRAGMTEVETDVESPPARGVEPLNVETAFTEMTQFVAIATAHYVPLPEKEVLSESWTPYVDWWKRLGKDDVIMSFNYDRVVERLEAEVGERCHILKLHGSTPEAAVLAEHLKQKTRIDTIHVPGPSKVNASQGSEWLIAGELLQNAARLIVIGYSFPASDALARTLVLGNFKGERVAIVVGMDDDKAGDRAVAMFRHVGTPERKTVVNTRMYAQTYLTDGTARAPEDRFMHEEFWVDDRERS
jgi:hypothetical protein